MSCVKQKAIELYQQGLTKAEVGIKLGIGYSTVRNYLTGYKNIPKNTHYKCRTCGASGKENFYENARYQCKKCWNNRTYQTTKDKIFEYMENRGGAKCQRCGYDKYVGALEFHHRDPAQKDPTWNRGWSMLKLKEELDKCDILCANCHREVHAELRNISK